MKKEDTDQLFPSTETMPPTKVKAVTALAEFKAYIMKHPGLLEVQASTLTHVINGAPGTFTAIIGPTGVGKTTLAGMLVKELAAEFEDAKKAGLEPIIQMPLKADEKEVFNWLDFYRRLLKILNGPYGDDIKKKGHSKAITTPYDRPDDLRLRIEEDAETRGLKVLILDEAHHMIMGAPETALESQLHVLKSLANCAGFHIVLLGTYDLIGQVNLNAELTRRVHFLPARAVSLSPILCALRLVKGPSDSVT